MNRVLDLFGSRENIIKFLRQQIALAAQDNAGEKALLVCIEIGRRAAKYGRKTLEDFTDEELEKTVGKIAIMICGFPDDEEETD